VPDASAVLDILLRAPDAGSIERRIFAAGESLHAPHLIDLEITQVLRRFTQKGAISDARAQEALRDLRDLPITRYPHHVLLDRVWDLRHNLTAYDAAYVALAEALEASLVTRDARLAAGSRRVVRVELL